MHSLSTARYACLFFSYLQEVIDGLQSLPVHERIAIFDAILTGPDSDDILRRTGPISKLLELRIRGDDSRDLLDEKEKERNLPQFYGRDHLPNSQNPTIGRIILHFLASRARMPFEGKVTGLDPECDVC